VAESGGCVVFFIEQTVTNDSTDLDRKWKQLAKKFMLLVNARSPLKKT